MEQAINLLIKKYNEALEKGEVRKARAYEREIINLRNMQKVMIITSLTNRENNKTLR